MRAIEYNEKLDADLAKSGMVDEGLLLKFLEAYRYDAATTVNWLVGKLRILSTRLSAGEPLSLYELKRKEQIAITSIVGFKVWVQAVFPGIEF